MTVCNIIDGPTPRAKWSNALPLTARSLSLLSKFEYLLRLASGFCRLFWFPPYLQLACHDFIDRQCMVEKVMKNKIPNLLNSGHE